MNKWHYKEIRYIIREVRDYGYAIRWILNKNYYEIYQVEFTRIDEFNVEIKITNFLLNEFVAKEILTMHMTEKIVEFVDIDGVYYNKKIDCVRDLYELLNKRLNRYKRKTSEKYKELLEMVEYLEENFPELLI